MHGKILQMLNRQYTETIESRIINNPVVAILGPRQCGKTTLAKLIMANHPNSVYIDLEKPSDLSKLDNAEWFFSANRGKLICIDEIQRKPELFALLRSIVDETNENGQFLVLGSASRDLIRQSSESLAGRISYITLSPLLINEIAKDTSIEKYLTRGGFPRSFLASSDEYSFQWRKDFITTFIERDILQFKGVVPATIRRLMTMIAHVNGQTINYSSIGNSLGISNVALKNNIDLLSGSFILNIVPQVNRNTGKRLVKAPKIYFSDPGIVEALLNLRNFNSIVSHPAFGSLWETLVLMNLSGNFPDAEISFYRTSNGAELDFIVMDNDTTVCIECKTNSNPTLTKGNFISIEDLKPVKTFVVSPVTNYYEYAENIIVTPLSALPGLIREQLS